MPQPDGSNACCDCPDRASPCDDCAPAGGACCVDGVCSIQTSQDCTDMGGVYHGDGTTCDEVDCSCSEGTYLTSFTVSMTGTQIPSELCGAAPISLSLSGGGTCKSCSPGCGQLFVPITYACDPDFGCAAPARSFFIIAVVVSFDGTDWTISFNADPTQTGFCGSHASFGGDDMFEDNIGPDPNGSFSYSFDDPNNAGIHWSFSVSITFTP